jgi:YD repeat-containing protein
MLARVDYNARGQRVVVEHGNGTVTRYEYDPATFRVRRATTTRGAEHLQDLRYVYDPHGNVTAVRDAAVRTVFFRNRVVDPGGDYEYDALYRLVRATGREHVGQAGGGARPPSAHRWPTAPHPDDGAAMARYAESYDYDPVGNLLAVRHTGTDPSLAGWTRTYHYDEPSRLEPQRQGNRLSAVGTGDPDAPRHPLVHDEQGNVVSMPELPMLGWDAEDRLHVTSRQAIADGLGEATWNVYDATGTRVRKVTDRPGDGGARHQRAERVYVGPFERYREFGGDGEVTLERTSLHVVDEDRMVALVETRTRGDDRGAPRLVRHQYTDHLGSAVLELDQDARVLTYEEFHPYGSTAYEAGSATTRAGSATTGPGSTRRGWAAGRVPTRPARATRSRRTPTSRATR